MEMKYERNYSGPVSGWQDWDNQTATVRQDIAFGPVDVKGRAIGALVFTGECQKLAAERTCGIGYSPIAPGFYYWLYTSATRAGKAFGAGQSRRYFMTAASRDKAMASYIAGAMRRAAKREGA
jgi:hypothetical protein